MFDKIVHNGIVVTVNSDFDVIPDGIICIENDRIVRVQSGMSQMQIPDALEFIDARGGIIMPGLINTHSHLPMTLFRGLADDLPLMQWLNDHIFPAEQTAINPNSVYDASLMGCTEMLLSGTTTCCDGYFFEDKVAQAVEASGMRAILGQGIIDFPAPGVPDPSKNIDHAVEFVKKWQHRSPLIRPSLFCHSPYTCSETTLIKARKKATQSGVLFQIHIAETRNEWDQIQSEHGTSPVNYLNRIGILSPGTLLVHTIWVDEHDFQIMEQTGVSVSVTTESEMKLASGIASIPDFLDHNIPVGLGTDGCASNNNLDMFQEMDMTAKLHKVNLEDPTAIGAHTAVQLATILAARSIGMETLIGSLEPGKQADLIIIDTQKPHLTPMYDPVSHIVYAAKGSDVNDVIIAGRCIVRDRKIRTIDVQNLYGRINKICEKIKNRPSRSSEMV